MALPQSRFDSPVGEAEQRINLMTEAFRECDAIVEIGPDWLVRLKRAALDSPLGRSRVCVHVDDAATVQEMILAMRQDVLFRPHRHLKKTESFHMIEGALDIVVFDLDGTPTRAIQLSTIGSGKPFYYRLNESLFHAVLPRTPLVVFHETTTGPFAKNDAQFTDWAPQDPTRLRAFLEDAIKAAAARKTVYAERRSESAL
jgi:cupin fold WbuC family metalloprotein